MNGHLTKLIKVILKLDLPNTVLKLARVKCKQKRRHFESDEYLCPLTVAFPFGNFCDEIQICCRGIKTAIQGKEKSAAKMTLNS